MDVCMEINFWKRNGRWISIIPTVNSYLPLGILPAEFVENTIQYFILRMEITHEINSSLRVIDSG